MLRGLIAARGTVERKVLDETELDNDSELEDPEDNTIIEEEIFYEREEGLEATLTQTKTTGPGKKVSTVHEALGALDDSATE